MSTSRTLRLLSAAQIFVILAVAAFGMFGYIPRASTAEETIHLVVELRDIDRDNVSNLEEYMAIRRAVRDMQRLSDRVPRTYEVDGQEITARDLRRWRVVETTLTEAPELLETLRQHPAVASVAYEQTYSTAALPNDPMFSQQYGLNSTLNALADINAPAAWDVTTGSTQTVIAVLDGGVDIQHPDLKSKIWANPGEVAGNSIDDDGNGFVDDVHGWDFYRNKPAGQGIDHATHVAGIAAADSNNGLGVAGVDWGARIMSVKGLSDFGTGSETNIVRGMEYAMANGADIINMSLVGPPSEALLAAVENAYANGVLVVAAAGNFGGDTGRARPYPACAETSGVNMVVGVGATDQDGEPASFSAYGTCVDISAPGKDIFSTAEGNDYRKMSGTSMSAPFVSGVAGLYLAQHPGASPAEVITALRRGDPFTGKKAAQWNAAYGGKLNAAAVVGASSSTNVQPSPTPSPSVSPTTTPLPSPSSSPNNIGSGSSDGGGDSGGGGGGGDCCAAETSSSSAPAKKPQAAGATKAKPNLLLLSQIKTLFHSVFGRSPIAVEHRYWEGRVKRAEKRTSPELRGAMMWQAARGLTYVPDKKDGRAGNVAGAQSLIHQINAIHRQAYGRNPTASEHSYWLGRVVNGDKNSEIALLGAMLFHRLAGIVH